MFYFFIIALVIFHSVRLAMSIYSCYLGYTCCVIIAILNKKPLTQM